MSQPDYTYVFGTVKNRMRHVHLEDHYNHTEREFQIALYDEKLLDNWNTMSLLLSDMADLAVAVSVADRMSKRYGDRPYEIVVKLPVRQSDVFSGRSFQARLHNLLYRYTGDYWTFTFQHGRDYQRVTQLRLDADPSARVEVALWSGGLDSAAGLYNRLLGNTADRYVLFGTGGSTHVHSIQSQVAQAVAEDFPDRTRLIQALIDKSGTQAIPKNSSSRSRGFTFLLLGAVCSQLAGQSRLHIYENGIGAINLPYRASEVGLDHARSVHPVSLWEMGELVSLLLGEPFAFENPFVFWTKAQMCQVFADRRYGNIPALTLSCDSRHRQEEFPVACGFCSSCLLRRQALTACGVEDRTHYVVTHGRSPRPDDSLHLRAMLFQVDALGALLALEDIWSSLVLHYTELDETADRMAQALRLPITEVRERLVALYHCYVEEWNTVHERIEGSFRVASGIAA